MQKHIRFRQHHRCTSLAFINLCLFSLLNRWGNHAARFRHGPHPYWMWRFRLTHKFQTGLKGFFHLRFRSMHLFLQKRVINFPGRKICQVWRGRNTAVPGQNAMRIKKGRRQCTNGCSSQRTGVPLYKGELCSLIVNIHHQLIRSQTLMPDK